VYGNNSGIQPYEKVQGLEEEQQKKKVREKKKIQR